MSTHLSIYFSDDKSINGDKAEEDPEVEEDDGDDVEEDETYYDQKKSFFDNISCEATERQKGSVQCLLYVDM